MIKVSCDWGKVECGIKGTLPVLCADTATILRAIYEGIEERDEGMAKEWKKQFDNGSILKCVFNPDEVEREVKNDNKMALAHCLLDFLSDMLNDDDDEEDE